MIQVFTNECGGTIIFTHTIAAAVSGYLTIYGRGKTSTTFSGVVTSGYAQFLVADLLALTAGTYLIVPKVTDIDECVYVIGTDDLEIVAVPASS